MSEARDERFEAEIRRQLEAAGIVKGRHRAPGTIRTTCWTAGGWRRAKNERGRHPGRGCRAADADRGGVPLSRGGILMSNEEEVRQVGPTPTDHHTAHMDTPGLSRSAGVPTCAGHLAPPLPNSQSIP